MVGLSKGNMNGKADVFFARFAIAIASQFDQEVDEGVLCYTLDIGRVVHRCGICAD
jgi:hypothetical protein